MNFDTFFAGQSVELVPPDVREGEIAVREIMHSSVIKRSYRPETFPNILYTAF